MWSPPSLELAIPPWAEVHENEDLVAVRCRIHGPLGTWVARHADPGQIQVEIDLHDTQHHTPDA